MNKTVALEEVYNPLPFGLVHALISACQANPDREMCGFVSNRSISPYFIENRHDTPESNFYMSIADIQKAAEIISADDDHIVGVFHSHPGGQTKPSENDVRGWPNKDLNWRYFIVTPTQVHEWEIR